MGERMTEELVWQIEAYCNGRSWRGDMERLISGWRAERAEVERLEGDADKRETELGELDADKMILESKLTNTERELAEAREFMRTIDELFTFAGNRNIRMSDLQEGDLDSIATFARNHPAVRAAKEQGDEMR